MPELATSGWPDRGREDCGLQLAGAADVTTGREELPAMSDDKSCKPKDGKSHDDTDTGVRCQAGRGDRRAS